MQEDSLPDERPMTQSQAASIGKCVAPSNAQSSSDAASADAVPSTTDESQAAIKMEEDSKNESAKTEEKKEVPPAQALPTKPEPEWVQHKPGSHDETSNPADQLPPRPEWYEKDTISDMERSMLPEWFDSSSPHRTPESYLETREKIIKMSDTMATRNVTNAMIRRVVVGDAGSLQRLRTFLVNWGIINEDAHNDTMPTPSGLRANLKRPKQFSEDMRGDLISAVVEQAKRRKLGQDADGDHDMGVESSASSFVPIDWDEVANQVGHGASAEECQQNFLMEAFPKEEPASSSERPITPDASQESAKPTAEEAASSTPSLEAGKTEGAEREFFQKIVEESNPHVLKAVLDAAIGATDGNLVKSQAATVVGLQLAKTIEEARGHEVDLAARLSKLVDARMQKLENRMAMMDDIEGMLEAEKVALELERRDLYTARCRHWFGGL
jgi:SWI/SNF related-matrix-associated actin-dependent regulator of chromatin subfamily C